MTTISDIFDIPTQVHQGDFVLRLTEGVTRPDDTLRDYVVTPQLSGCFDQALELIRSAMEANTSKGAYLHGSFGSGKSHFMAVLTLLLQNHVGARSIPELATVVMKHNAWTTEHHFLVVPYHMIGATSLEAAILGHYVAHIRALHPQAPTPAVYRAERLFDNARQLRDTMGDAAFFANLVSPQGGAGGWGNLEGTWDAARFEAALAAPPSSDEHDPQSDERKKLVSDLVDAYFPSMRDLATTENEAFVTLDQGLAVMSKHAQALGYDGVVLFLDELILWLASRAADIAFVNREGQKVAQLVEAMVAERPIPIISFIARQRDLRELVGEHLPGAEQLGFGDVLNWWEARFDAITLEDRNLPVIVEKRLLRPRSKAAALQLQEAFTKTARVRDDIMNTLLTRTGDRDMFRQVYPFSPALVQTLVAISSLLQRERTALKLMLQLLVNQRDTLQLGDIMPVGDLFDVIADGDEPFTQAIRIHFDNAKKLYRQKLLPMLEQTHETTLEAVQTGTVDAAQAQRFRTDDRLVKTLILSALTSEVEALHALTPSRLAALNHGTVRSPIPGQESQIVLNKCRNWAAQVGEIKISDDSPNPVISVHLVGVDTEGILANAQSIDNTGNRIQKARTLLYEQLGIDPEGAGFLRQRYTMLWRGTRRECEILFHNIRELSPESFRAQEGTWRIVIDYPFDQAGYTPQDDRAKVQEYIDTGASSDCLVWLPSFFNLRAMEDLGRLVLLEHVLSSNNLHQYGSHLSQLEREQARGLLQNQRDQMRQRIRNYMLTAYGISTTHRDAIDTSHDLEQHFMSLNPALILQPPVGATFQDALGHLFAQALARQFPAHPEFTEEIRRPAIRRVLDVVRQATQVRDGRVEVERARTAEVRQIVVPLQLGNMGEAHFVLRDDWKQHFLRKQAETGEETLTVRKLRAWMDQPEAMGLSKDVQNLLILSFALQSNLTFSLYGGPVEPRLEDLDNALELYQQPLPDADLWQEAVRRAAAILKVEVAPLLNATNAAILEKAVRDAARQWSAISAWCQALEQRLHAFELDPQAADRLRTARMAEALVTAIAGAEKDDVVRTVATAEIATSEAAMGEALRQAADLTSLLENTQWGLFDTLGRWQQMAQVGAVMKSVTHALMRDEHVVPLRGALQEAQATALALLDAILEPAQPPNVPPPATTAPAPATRGKTEVAQAQRGLGPQEAASVFEAITQALEADGDLVVDVEWRLYRKPQA